MDSLKEFRSLLNEAELIDDRYDATGSHIWLPYGLKLRNRMFTLLQEHFEQEGYDQYEFPLLIPESYLHQQEKAVPSFEDSVCWVDRFGTDDLEEPYYLRPTGEAQIYPMIKHWIRSYRDLPLKLLLIEPMFRAFKGGTPLLSGQGSHLIEGHGFHSDRQSAERELEEASKYVDEALESIGLGQSLVVQRPLWGNRPVSERTIGFDVVTPLNRTIMAASLYMQGEIYSDAYDLVYRDEDNETQTMTTIDWGLSTRVLGISLLLFADERGFRVLPQLSPIQIVFVSINNDDNEIDLAETLAEALPFRTKVDTSNENLGRRFEMWEQIGVPLRVEIGPDELNSDTITIFRRDINERLSSEIKSIESFSSLMGGLLDDIEENLQEVAANVRKENIKIVDEAKTISKVIDEGNVAQFSYCGSKDCGVQIESMIDGEILGTDLRKAKEGNCINCSVETNRIAYASRRF